ncbi:MAG: isoleucine--tRNA ligase [Blastochloris viridis]|uniref:Isoleucine--tRNA ligase n=1 Tax=Blastochloris viridis TaxID=1079 RepID=A0A6N4R9M1_BLAVI|nr:MAG: isoleucine--tRNA ligase [Blastochloris viridis]
MSEALNAVSKKAEKPEQNAWSDTLHLPKTEFPMRAGLAQREPGWVQRWLDNDVYNELCRTRLAEKAPVYIVHLGPPYANGRMHMGHALTYTLKDFVVRSKFMAGFYSPYAPGWDCHGLPIEWKVEQDLRAEGKSKHDISKTELRARCRAYAQKWVDVQKADWQRFGALGDWEHPYLTMAPKNEAGIVRELGKLVARGLVEKNLRSTQWSWAEETAMAEAEVEYKDVTSTAVYVALPIVGRDNEHLVIWTTTPWTLPANRAVAVKVDETYVRLGTADESFWVAKELADSFRGAVGRVLPQEMETRSGEQLVGWQYKHPLYDTLQPVVEGFHVTTDAGTGLVHIAPAHGAEDFQIGKQFGLELVCPVDGAGKYVKGTPNLPVTGESIEGQLIWPMQKKILAELEANGRLLSAKDFQHSYPVSWRSKEKLIFRTTEQWFVTLDKPIKGLIAEQPELEISLRDASLARIYGKDGKGHEARKVNWVPEYGMNRIGSMIENRPDWCISRQRAWGVPITIFMVKKTGIDGVTEGLVTDPAVFEHVAKLIEAETIDAWDSRIESGRVAELFPANWLESRGLTVADVEPVTDILDVWFDSGTSHAHVLRAESGEGQRFHREDGKRPADLYQEGSDQHRGWFHSALLTSVANYGDAPYENVVTSGFVVDGEGRKFSKSLGNGVEPHQLMEKYGMDIIRLWVASTDYSEDIRYSPQIMDSMADAYRRFRNTFRWLLGTLNGVEDMPLDVQALPELERYMLHRLGTVLGEVRAHYDAYQFHKGYRALYEFCGTELSNFYFDVRKDVLYCDAATSPTRTATLAVLVQVFRGLVTHLAPVMPFTTDEAWRERYGESACVHLERFQTVPEVTVDTSRWNALFDMRDAVNSELEKLRAAGGIGANTEADVTVADAGTDAELVREVLGVSRVNTGSDLRVAKHDGHKCPRCWRYYGKVEQSGLCLRCDEAVADRKTQQGAA